VGRGPREKRNVSRAYGHDSDGLHSQMGLSLSSVSCCFRFQARRVPNIRGDHDFVDDNHRAMRGHRVAFGKLSTAAEERNPNTWK